MMVTVCDLQRLYELTLIIRFRLVIQALCDTGHMFHDCYMKLICVESYDVVAVRCALSGIAFGVPRH
jgi:hypothetical protein